MKTAVVHVLYGGLGGHFNVLKNLFEADVEQEFKLSVVFYGIEPVRTEYANYCHENNIPFVYVPKRKGIDIGFFRNLKKAIAQSQAQTIFLHSAYPIIAAKKAKKLQPGIKKIVIRETQANHLKSKLEVQFTKRGLKSADHIVLLTAAYAEELALAYHEFDSSKITVIPNGIVVPKSNPHKVRDEIKNIGMLSRIVAIKDHETLIKSIQGIDGIQLHIAGDGENLAKLKELTVELGLKNEVIFHGMIDPNQVPQFLTTLDVYIHASYGETMSNSIMQAQAAGLPIIGTDVNGINNVIIHSENGLLVALQNVESYKNAITQLKDNKELREKLSSASFNYADQKLRREVMFNAYKSVLK